MVLHVGPATLRSEEMRFLQTEVGGLEAVVVEQIVGGAGEGIAYLWTTVFGQAGRPLTATLGVSAQSIYGAAARGCAARPRWDRLLDKLS